MAYVERHLKRKRAFLAAYAISGTIKSAAGHAGINRTLIYEWLSADEEFKAAFDDTQRKVADLLQDEAVRRAHDGVERPIIHAGQLVTVKEKRLKLKDGERIPLADGSGFETEEYERALTEVTYSDTLLIFLLKGLKPELFKERSEVQHKGVTLKDLDRMTAAAEAEEAKS